VADSLAIKKLLRQHRSSFVGQEWKPQKLADLTTLGLVLGVVDKVVRDLVDLDLTGLSSSGYLERRQRMLRRTLEHLATSRKRNQAEFFIEVGKVFEHVGSILEELERLSALGSFD
jgi:hypothetical protein